MREMKTALTKQEEQEQLELEDSEYIWVDPENPLPNPELGPLERRVSLEYADALESEEIDPEAMRYWFSSPPGGWQTEKRRMRKAESWVTTEEELEGGFCRTGEPDAASRLPLAQLQPGQVLRGKVVGHYLYHGMQIDVGAEYDGLLWMQEEHWDLLAHDASVRVGAELSVVVHAVRDTGLFRFPLQLAAHDPQLAGKLPPPEEHEPPMDLRVMPMDPERLAEISGRDYQPEEVVLQTQSEVDARNGNFAWEESSGPLLPPTPEQLDYIASLL